jgi:hypothetical protein
MPDFIKSMCHCTQLPSIAGTPLVRVLLQSNQPVQPKQKSPSSLRDEKAFRDTTRIHISFLSVSSIFQYPRPDRKRMDTAVIGGPEGARTPDLIHAMDALFQLRYRPRYSEICTHFTRYRAYRQALETLRQLPSLRFFRPAAHRRVRPVDVAFAPTGYSLRECWPTTPAHCIMCRYYTTDLCALQGTVVSSGDEGARTPDLDSAIVALFQLSYIPVTQAIIPYSCSFVKRGSSPVIYSVSSPGEPTCSMRCRTSCMASRQGDSSCVSPAASSSSRER